MALDKLDAVLETHAELIRQQAEGNRIAEAALQVERDAVANRQRELDLQARDLDLRAQELAQEREKLKRAQKSLDEVLQRYIAAEGKLLTIDDAFGETVQRLINEQRNFRDAQRDIQQAIHTLLTKEISEMQNARSVNKRRLDKGNMQDLLAEYYANLQKYELKAANYGGDVPVKLMNDIEATRQSIADLEARLG